MAQRLEGLSEFLLVDRAPDFVIVGSAGGSVAAGPLLRLGSPADDDVATLPADDLRALPQTIRRELRLHRAEEALRAVSAGKW